MNNGDKDILEIMKGFGLLGSYANLLVLGTSFSEKSINLYNYLKDMNLEVDNHFIAGTYYDFIFSPKKMITVIDYLLTNLRTGGIILIETGTTSYNVSIKGNYLQINKSIGLAKNERNW